MIFPSFTPLGQHRSPPALLVGAAALLLLASGCRWLGPGPRPTVENLFQTALSQSAAHPENSYAADLSPTTAHVADAKRWPETLPPTGASGPNDARISETFAESDIREALQLMATAGKKSLIIDDKVRGVVNATIEDLPFEQALDRVLLPLGLVYAKRGNDYLIGTAELDSALFPLIAEHHTYTPRHRTAPQLLTTLPERIRRFARVAENTNQILIDAPPHFAALILRRLAEADAPIPQVMLEAIVCIVAPDSAIHFGLDGTQSLQVNNANALSLGFSGLNFNGQVTPYGLRHALDDFALTSAFVRLLATNGYLTIRASPRVMAKDGEKAMISIAQETFFSAQQSVAAANSGAPASGGSGAAVYFPQNIQKVDAGIVLNITPQIRGDNITVHIERAEVSENITNSSLNTASNPYPIINRRTVSTTVHVKDGKTIVIGGLAQRQTVESVSRVPGLSRIPLLGRAFQTIDRREQDVEVVIFISPRIIAAPGDDPSAAAKE